MNFHECIVRNEMVGQQECRLGDISTYPRSLDKFRITDLERETSHPRRGLD